MSTISFAALFSTTDHRDAGLLEAIDQFTDLTEECFALIRRAERLKSGRRAYNQLWKQALATRDERDQLERQIVTTKAQTSLGVAAKLNLWLALHADNDGTMLDLPRAAMTEALAMLEAGA